MKANRARVTVFLVVFEIIAIFVFAYYGIAKTEYANERNIPVLEYQSEENYADACNDFYDKIYSQQP